MLWRSDTYTAALRAWLTPEQPFLRAVYIDFPDDPTALSERRRGHYMFGSSVLVQAVTTPRSAETNLSTNFLHFPAFEDPKLAWVERTSGRCFQGGVTLEEVGYRLQETAEFIRPVSRAPKSTLLALLRAVC